jgi:hypothetical protein
MPKELCVLCTYASPSAKMYLKHKHWDIGSMSSNSII